MSNVQRKINAHHGICVWLNKKGLKTTKKFISDVTYEFLKFKGLPCSRFNPRYKGSIYAGVNNAESVQEHFDEFKSFVIQKISNNNLTN